MGLGIVDKAPWSNPVIHPATVRRGTIDWACWNFMVVSRDSFLFLKIDNLKFEDANSLACVLVWQWFERWHC